MIDNWPILTMTIILPLIGALFVSFVPKKYDKNAIITKNYILNVKLVGIWTSSMTFFLSLLLVVRFDDTTKNYQFFEFSNWLSSFGIIFKVGLDGLSLPFILLTTFFTLICILYSWNTIHQKIKEFMITFLILESFTLGLFSSLDLSLFYIFYVFILIPIFFIIGIWGGVKRIQASFKFFLYTFFSSIFMLIPIIYLKIIDNSIDISNIHNIKLTFQEQIWLFIGFFMSLAVRISLWPFQTWLIEVHDEVPTVGSIILSVILLNVGGYGLIRFSIPFLSEIYYLIQPIIFLISFVSIIYGFLMILTHKDLKKIVAYLTIINTGIITLGIFCFNKQCLDGSIFHMISWSFISAGLFIAIGVIYEKTQIRDINFLGDFATKMPHFSVFLIIFILAYIGLPLTSGFVGYFLILLGFWKENPAVTLTLGIIIIFCSIYMLKFYKKISFGESKINENLSLTDVDKREMSLLLILSLLILIFGIFPNFILDFLDNFNFVYK